MYSGIMLTAEVVQFRNAIYTVPFDCALHVAKEHDLPEVFAGTAKANLYPVGTVGVPYAPAIPADGTVMLTLSMDVFTSILLFS